MRYAFLAYALLLGLCACSSPRLLAEGPFPTHEPGPDGPRAGGIRYYLGKDVLTVTGTTTHKSTLVIEDGKLKKVTEVSAEGELGRAAVPDMRQVFRLEMEPNASADQTLAVTLRAGGMLSQINATSTGKAGAILGKVAKFAGTALGLAAGAASGGATTALGDAAAGMRTAQDLPPGPPGVEPSPPPVSAWPWDPLSMRLQGRVAREMPASPEVMERAGWLWRERRFGLSDRTAYYLNTSAAGLGRYARVLVLDAWIDIIDRRRLDLLQFVVVVRPAPDVVIDGEKRVKALKEARTEMALVAAQLGTERASLETQLKAALTSWKAAQTAFWKTLDDAEAGESAPSFDLIFDVTDLPPPGVIETAPNDLMLAMDVDLARMQSHYPRAMSLFLQHKVLMTISAPPPEFLESGEPACVVPPLRAAREGRARPGRIFYRQSYPAIISTWVATGSYTQDVTVLAEGDDRSAMSVTVTEKKQEGAGELRLVSQQTVDIMHPFARLEYLEFDPGSFAKHNLKMTFSEAGHLLTVHRQSDSELEAATGAAGDALRGARDEYATSISKVAEIERNLQSIEKNRVQAEIDALNGRLDVLKKMEELEAKMKALEAGSSDPR